MQSTLIIKRLNKVNAERSEPMNEQPKCRTISTTITLLIKKHKSSKCILQFNIMITVLTFSDEV